jgi:uroporphyrinogen decarboxylase
MIVDYSCKNKDDWDRMKPRLKANDYRVDWVSSLQSFHREDSRGRFLIYWLIVGYDKIAGAGSYLSQERLLKAIIQKPEWVIDMYRTDAELCIKMCERMMKAGFRFDGAFLGCDLAYRTGLFFSPKHYEEQLHPVFKDLCRYFHSKDMFVFLHSDGMVKELIPYFIEEGVDCLHPLEVKSGMDLIQLKEEYGDKISFMGGIDVRLMALDNPKPIEKEIEKKISAAKEGGGYIYSSDHSVPNNVSFKQYRRVIEFVKKYGKYK